MKYRPEINGLRGIAVLLVIFFHAGFEWVKGGFIGVDIFFVISGFLITSIMLEEASSGSFSVRNFYLKRARRILPALLFITIVTIPFAYYILLPFHLEDYAKSLLTVPTFVSNIYFFKQSGYFDIDAELKPLLHIWSLAVE